MKKVIYTKENIDNILEIINTLEIKGIENAKKIFLLCSLLQQGEIKDTAEGEANEQTE